MSSSIDVLSKSILGWEPSEAQLVVGNSMSGVALASLNAGYVARFIPTDTRDIKSVPMRWTSISAPGTVQLRIETVDATTGKPTGTLYDANAVKSFTPTSGNQIVTFDTLPTTGLVAGTEYAIVLLTTVGGTTMTLGGYIPSQFVARLPAATLTAADGTTRSNFAEVVSSRPTIALIMEDNAYETFGMLPAYTGGNITDCYAARAVGAKFTLPTSVKLWGIGLSPFYRGGTPTGNIRVRIFDTSNTVLHTVIADKDSLTNTHTRSLFLPFPDAPITLAAGTYRWAGDQTDHSSTSGNYWRINAMDFQYANLVPSGWIYTYTLDIDAGTIVWVDEPTKIVAGYFALSDIPAAAGGVLLGNARGGFQN